MECRFLTEITIPVYPPLQSPCKRVNDCKILKVRLLREIRKSFNPLVTGLLPQLCEVIGVVAYYCVFQSPCNGSTSSTAFGTNATERVYACFNPLVTGLLPQLWIR